MKKIKVYIDGGNRLNMEMLRENSMIEITSDHQTSDVIISHATVTYPEFRHKTIYLSNEAPRTSHRKWCYSHFDDFKLVVAMAPENGKKNQISWAPDNAIQFYPTRADATNLIRRTDTKIKTGGVFFAGHVCTNDIIADTHGGYDILHIRRVLGEYFIQNFPGSKIIGIGWNNQTEKARAWRDDKFKQINDSECDFVLALENTIYPNYLSEKIWDGIVSDRVTLYLGDPNIERHIPLNCFIDLRDYFDINTKQIDVVEIGKRLKSMPQSEYDTILNNARNFFQTSIKKFQYYRDLLTKQIIEFLVSEYIIKDATYSKEAYDFLFTTKSQYQKHYNDLWYIRSWRYIMRTLKRTDKLLELGCGCGHFSHMLHDNEFYDYVGIDFSSVGLSQARKKSPNHTFIEADICKYDYSSYSDSKIICLETFEHIENDILLLKTLPKVEIVFSVPNFWSDSHIRVYPNTLFIKKYYQGVLKIHNIRPFHGSGKNKIFVIRAKII